jgi:hypothetical protein
MAVSQLIFIQICSNFQGEIGRIEIFDYYLKPGYEITFSILKIQRLFIMSLLKMVCQPVLTVRPLHSCYVPVR